MGGGSFPRPGEISLAHRGLLFLDEFPEFPRSVLESLRQPLEDGVVTVSRAVGSWEFPARFILVAAMNPCPCGFYKDDTNRCSCSSFNIEKYQKKLSGPLLDRIDLHVTVPRVKLEKIASHLTSESSLAIRQRVEAARQIQAKRFVSLPIFVNAEMSSRQVKQWCKIDKETSELLNLAAAKFRLSARSYFRILKIGRTIADLAGKENITADDVAEALQYRLES